MTSDDELRARLRSLDDQDIDSRLGAERGSALRERIMARAPRAMARRQRRTMWEYSSTWARVVVPVGLAASILAATMLYRAPAAPAGSESSMTFASGVTDDAWSVMRNVAYGGVETAEMLDSLVGPATRDALRSRVLRGAQ